MASRESDTDVGTAFSPRELLAVVEMGRMMGLSKCNVIRVALYRQALHLDHRVDQDLFAIRAYDGGNGTNTPARRHL